MQRTSPRYLPLLALVCIGLGAGCAASQPVDMKPFTIIVLPDTQNYADVNRPDLNHHFASQTDWIRKNRDALNIAMVAHVGDIVQNDDPDEWTVADEAFKPLDGVVPYILAQGNHDLHSAAGGGRATHMNDRFPPARFEAEPWYAGHHAEGSENSCALFEAGGRKFLVIALEFAPRDEVLDWANGIVARHPDRRCIVVTHGYLEDGRRIEEAAMGYPWKGNSAGQLWRRFVSRHENIFLVLSGHLRSCRLTSTGAHGNAVHQVQADYQFIQNGGDGYLRVMTFIPAENRIAVQTYSPSVDKYMTGEVDRFSLDYEMGAADGGMAAP